MKIQIKSFTGLLRITYIKNYEINKNPQNFLRPFFPFIFQKYLCRKNDIGRRITFAFCGKTNLDWIGLKLNESFFWPPQKLFSSCLDWKAPADGNRFAARIFCLCRSAAFAGFGSPAWIEKDKSPGDQSFSPCHRPLAVLLDYFALGL